MVIEAADHAKGRQAPAFARLTRVVSDRAKRTPGAITAALDRHWDALAPQREPGGCAIISGATGAAPATGEEQAFLAKHADVPVLAPASYTGHGIEAQFAMNISLAALALSRGRFFSAGQATAGGPNEIARVVVTSVGPWRGEGMALVEALPERSDA
jgi:3-oxoacyl-[acyl-carrier-protein] synthase II